MRVVSLVPSWTDSHDLQAEVWAKPNLRPDAAYPSLPRVGNTKTVHVDRVVELRPDLVVANKENARGTSGAYDSTPFVRHPCHRRPHRRRPSTPCPTSAPNWNASPSRILVAASRTREKVQACGGAAHSPCGPSLGWPQARHIHPDVRHWGIHNAVADLPSENSPWPRYRAGDDELRVFSMPGGGFCRPFPSPPSTSRRLKPAASSCSWTARPSVGTARMHAAALRGAPLDDRVLTRAARLAGFGQPVSQFGRSAQPPLSGWHTWHEMVGTGFGLGSQINHSNFSA